MIWPAAVLVTLAQKAGWTGPELVEAVAVALASSGGDDRLVTVDPISGLNTRTGLWQVRRGDVDLPTSIRLTVPSVNARAARFLYEAAGGAWTAFPAFAGPSYRQGLADALTAIQAPARGVLTGRLAPDGRLVETGRAARAAVVDAGGQLGGLGSLGRAGPRM